MKTMMFLLLFFPLCLAAQTVHLDGKKIEYKDKVKLEGLSQAEIFNRAKAAITELVNTTGELETEKNEEIKVDGELRLATPYPIIRKVRFSLKLEAKDSGYEYKIDDVELYEKHRGYEAKTISSKDLVDEMDESGTPAIEAEKILNAIDLNFQKLLVLLRNRIEKKSSF